MKANSILEALSQITISEIASRANALTDAVALFLEKRAQRRALLELNDDQLRDIGLSRCDAVREAGKSFWL